MAGYNVRQQSYFTDDIVEAVHTNDEYNRLLEVFDEVDGHRHDGSVGEGGFVPLISDFDTDTQVTVEETPDNDKIVFYAGGVKTMEVDNNGLVFGGAFRITYNSVTDTLDILSEI